MWGGRGPCQSLSLLHSSDELPSLQNGRLQRLLSLEKEAVAWVMFGMWHGRSSGGKLEVYLSGNKTDDRVKRREDIKK